MKNKNYASGFILLLVSVFVTGCFGGGDETPIKTQNSTETTSKNNFSLTVIESVVPKSPVPEQLFVEDIEDTTLVPKVELVKGYGDFSSAVFEELKGAGPLALFFTREDCERCDQMNDFFSRNLGALPNQTQILKVEWDKYPNLQTELNVRRPATMVFYKADGEVADTLLAPPIDRVIDFFSNAQAQQ